MSINAFDNLESYFAIRIVDDIRAKSDKKEQDSLLNTIIKYGAKDYCWMYARESEEIYPSLKNSAFIFAMMNSVRWTVVLEYVHMKLEDS